MPKRSDPTVHAPAPARIGRFDAFQRRHRWLGFPIAVFYKYFDDSGGYLAALITYYGFISLFPLLLLLATALGIVLAHQPHLQQQILGSALAQFPVIGSQLGTPQQISGGTAGLVVGIVGSLYGGLGVAQALQYAMNTAWTVPKNSRPNPLRARGRSLVLLLAAGLAVLATTALSIVANRSTSGQTTTFLLITGSLVLSVVIFTFGMRLATARPISILDVLPGAITMAVGWQLAQRFGVVYVAHVVKHASETNGVFAIVLGLVAFIYVNAVILVFAIEINVVRADGLHPRALLTPFTDNVELTDGDRRSYAGQARAQRSKGFQRISVRFERDQDSDDPEPD